MDKFVLPIGSIFHFNNDNDRKTYVGGIISISITLYVLIIALLNSIKMFQLVDPTITQIEDNFDYTI
jgi:hypothetical protein